MTRWGVLGRRSMIFVSAVVLVSAAACGSSGSEANGPALTSPPVTSPPPVLTVGELTDTLLTITDLPPGWSKSPVDTSGSGSAQFLCPLGATADRTESHPTAYVMFQQSEMGPLLVQELSSAPDAEAHFADAQRVFDSCVSQTWDEDFGGTSVPVTMTQVSGATAGERSISYRISGTDSSGEVSLTMDFTLVTRSTVLEMYAVMNLSSPYLTIAQMTPAEFSGVVAKGDAKVVATLDRTTNDTAVS